MAKVRYMVEVTLDNGDYGPLMHSTVRTAIRARIGHRERINGLEIQVEQIDVALMGDSTMTIDHGDAPIMTDTGGMDSIASLLSGTEWDSEMLETVAEFVRLTGREVLDPDDPAFIPTGTTIKLDRAQPKVDNPYTMDIWHSPTTRFAWDEGYKHGLAQSETSLLIDDQVIKGNQEAWDRGYAHGKAQCNHHPEALTREEYGNQIDTAYQSGHDVGVADGNGLKSTRIRDLERKINRLEALETSRKVEVADLERKVGHLKFAGKKQEFRVANLVRLNGNQSEIISQGTFDEGNEEGYADGVAQGRRDMALEVPRISEEVLAKQRKAGFEEGRKHGLQDWMMHFILYMQENDQDFAVVKLSQLNEMRDTVTNLRATSNKVEDLDQFVEELETVLTRLETIDR